MRHAEADKGSDDALRPLSSRGREDLPRLARFFHAAGWPLDESLASPLLRTRESQEILSEELKKLGALGPSYSAKTEESLKPGLPSLESSAEILQGKDSNSCILWIFHAPDVSYLASALTGMPATGYYFSPGSMLALNLNPFRLGSKGIQVWQIQPEHLRKLFSKGLF